MKLREAAIEAMVQESARARLSATWRTHATKDGHALQLRIVDSVDCAIVDDTKKGGKDVSPWKGPAEVVDLSQISRGTISLKTRAGKIVMVRTQNVRPHLHFFRWLGTSLTLTSWNVNVEVCY